MYNHHLMHETKCLRFSELHGLVFKANIFNRVCKSASEIQLPLIAISARASRLIFLIAILMQSFFVDLHAQCSLDNRVFGMGETAVYKAYYNWNFIWIEAADVQFSVKKVADNRIFDLESIGTSLPKHDWFFMVRDTFRSRVDARTLLPLVYHRKTSEGGYKVDNRYQFNYSDSTVFTETYNSDDGAARDTFNLPICTFDVLSAIYYTRSLDFAKLSIDDKIPVKVLIDNEFNDLFIRYLGTEDVVTRAGVSYNCIKFSVLLVEGTVFKGGEDMFVWVTNDEKRVPIVVEAKVIIGSVKAYLTHYNP